MWESREGVSQGFLGSSGRGTPRAFVPRLPGFHHHCGGSGARTWLPSSVADRELFLVFTTAHPPQAGWLDVTRLLAWWWWQQGCEWGGQMGAQKPNI